MSKNKITISNPISILLYINDFSIANSSSAFEYHLFADESTLFYSNNCLVELENKINIELSSIYDCLSANKLSLNIEKSNFVIFHPPQKKLLLKGKYIRQEHSIKYLGVMTDEYLNWKSYVLLLKVKSSAQLECCPS